MNKTVWTSFLVFLCVLPLMGFKMSARAETNVIRVPSDYEKIQEAINNASTGDTILVHSGTYYENILINKSVLIFGEDRSTILDGNRTGNVISITADDVSVEGFTIKRSGTGPFDCGVFVDHAQFVDISHNAITDNLHGIILGTSSWNNCSGNTILNNDYGISLYFSSNNQFSGNTISSNNKDGIGFYSSSKNIFSGNTISSNQDHGMYSAVFSKENLIYNNNFNNTFQVWCDSMNFWDYEDEGNYWSDYEGQDMTGDGIGDTVYLIDTNNRDEHPLMGVFSEFSVALGEETNSVTTVCNLTITEFRFEIGAETGNKMIRFNVAGKDDIVGFCRVMIPTQLMNYPNFVLVGLEEIDPIPLNVSTEESAYIYFNGIHGGDTVTIVSSKIMHLYDELRNRLDNYSFLLDNFGQLQKNYNELTASYEAYLQRYSENVRNIRNLMYIFAATTAIFIITIIYLSKQAHARNAQRSKT